MDNRFFTYVLFSDGFDRLYIGHTNNLQKRFFQHNKGKVTSTKPYVPYSLVYFEEHAEKNEAARREKELKTSVGRRYLKQFI